MPFRCAGLVDPRSGRAAGRGNDEGKGLLASSLFRI
jgi:hypothetical protein